MNPTAHDEYLTTEVMTASPQKLQLMLVEAALRQCERTRRMWSEGKDDLASESLTRTQEIVTEILASLNYAEHPELAQRIAAVYNFVFRSLVTAHVRKDEKCLADAVRVLEIERGTWRELAQRQSGAPAPPPRATHAAHAVPAPVRIAETPTSSFSFEA